MTETTERGLVPAQTPEATVRDPGIGVAIFAGVACIALQRLGIPLAGGVAPIFPFLVAAGLVFAFIKGALRLEPMVVVGYVVVLFTGALMCVGKGASATSLLLVALIWLPSLFTVRSHWWTERFTLGLCIGTAAGAALGIVQSIANLAVGVFVDPIASLPKQILVQGFNTTYEVVFGSGWLKANGMLFLEPSMLSLFCVVALTAVVEPGYLKIGGSRRIVLGVLLAAGAIASVAISGLVVLPALVWALGRTLYRGRARSRLSVLVSLLGIAVLVVGTRWGQAFVLRASAGWDQSSNSMRLVKPFTEMLPTALTESPWIGLGPGSLHRATLVDYSGWESEVATPTLAKLGYEYGLVGLAALLLLLLALVGRRPAPGSVIAAFIVALTIPIDGLASGIVAPAALLMMMGRSGSGSGSTGELGLKRRRGDFPHLRRDAVLRYGSWEQDRAG